MRHMLLLNAACGFSGFFGSTDCQHWSWKLYPVAWVGQFRGKGMKPSVVLEAIRNGELWIWHYFFGSFGSLNDIYI